ncbi:unnamed protein product [Clonostachys byssicola]|uniref:Uncharacterized protein n=1 Tax=Clonostachys byssicola TaxID=160290 RepID=A0A9N9Y066_9HYPO|nr:unnamed protein product [Clonostachys byssicola]
MASTYGVVVDPTAFCTFWEGATLSCFNYSRGGDWGGDGDRDRGGGDGGGRDDIDETMSCKRQVGVMQLLFDKSYDTR